MVWRCFDEWEPWSWLDAACSRRQPSPIRGVIKYVALEGPEAGTYFRGRSRFQRGRAVIGVPEHFRLVTDPDGITVQITPIGQVAGYAVISIGMERIEVQGTRDVEFFYHVNGVRKAFKDFQPVQVFPEEKYFVPHHPGQRIEEVISSNEELRKRLISNGTFNPDGSVNIDTAERIGWAAQWREDEARRQLYIRSHQRVPPTGEGSAVKP